MPELPMKGLFLACLLFCVVNGYGQSRVVRGSVVDSTGEAIIGAVVKLSTATDSIKTSTNVNGAFLFNSIKFPSFKLTVSYIGFETYAKDHKPSNSSDLLMLDTVRLKESTGLLHEISLTAIIPVRVKEDTVEYNAAAYPVRDGDAVEEVIKKLPGVTVDRDGNVMAQGKPITKIRVNGKDYFGTDVATAIQNLPADIVKNLQVIDDYGDQAKLTGVKMGEPEKILNITIKPDKNKGYFARGTGGMGNEDRFIANMKGNSTLNERMLSFDGSFNNTNVRGGGGDGITKTKALALSYRNELGKKLSVDAGYNFNARDNSTLSTVFRQNVYQTFTRFDNQASNNSSGNTSQSFWGNLEYRMDSVNYIKISPNVSYNTSRSNNAGLTNTVIKKTGSIRDNLSSGNTASPAMGLNLFYNHKFQKKSRNINLSGNINFSDNENDRDARNNYTNIDSNNNQTYVKQYQLTANNNESTRYGTNLTFTEPLGKTSFLDISYNWNRSETHSSRDTRDVDPITGQEVFNASLSNHYRYQFTTNRFGLNYRSIHPKINYTFGLNIQPALLAGQNISGDIDTRKRTLNWIPAARVVYRISKQESLTFNYNGRSNQPGFNQLQPITDNSNLQNTVAGNPDLKPDFTHGLNLDYNQSDWKQGYNMFSNISYTRTQNKIVTTKIVLPDAIKQVTSYTNTNGFYSVNGRYSFSKPFRERMYVLSYYGSANFNNNIAFTNQQRNVAKNLVIEQGLKFHLDIKNIIDAELNTSYVNNKTNYSLPSVNDRKTNRYMLGLSGRNYFFNDISLGYDLSQVVNRGFSASANANPTILNVYLDYRFMKGNKANIRLQGFDLMNQNTGISRDVFDNEIVDRQTNRLARYFLLSMSLKMNKYTGSTKGKK